MKENVPKSIKIFILISISLFSLSVLFYFLKNISTQSLLAQISDFMEREKDLKNEIFELKEKILILEKELTNLKDEIEQTKNLKIVSGELETKNQIKRDIEEKKEQKEEIKICQNFDETPKHEMIFNEICWMGSENSPTDEWIELKNISEKEIDLTGWQILNKNQKIKIIFEERKISPGEILLLSRGDDFTGPIRNSQESLFLFDKDCNLQDKIDATSTWPAGDNKTKRTAERKKDLSWQTSEESGGTPGKENSKGLVIVEETKKEKEKIEPKISLNYPSEIFSQKEFEVSLFVSDLRYDTYDVKISILKISDESESKRIISEISLDGQEWQDSFKYLENVFTGNSFSGKFKLRISEEFSGQAEILAKIRNKNKKVVAEAKEKITILSLEISQPKTEISQPKTVSQDCIDINSASKEELMKIKWIGEKVADQIIEERSKKPFLSLDELAERIKYIGPSRLADIKAQGLACVK